MDFYTIYYICCGVALTSAIGNLIITDSRSGRIWTFNCILWVAQSAIWAYNARDARMALKAAGIETGE